MPACFKGNHLITTHIDARFKYKFSWFWNVVQTVSEKIYTQDCFTKKRKENSRHPLRSLELEIHTCIFLPGWGGETAAANSHLESHGWVESDRWRHSQEGSEENGIRRSVDQTLLLGGHDFIGWAIQRWRTESKPGFFGPGLLSSIAIAARWRFSTRILCG